MVKKRKKTVKTEQKKVKKSDKAYDQFLALVLIIVGLVIGILFVPMIYHQIFGKFEYAGVKFEKIKEAKIDFYHGQFPIIYKGNLTAVYNVYLRNDPRKNNIPINTNISLSKEVYVSLEESVAVCKDAILAQTELGKFIPSFPWVKDLKPAMTTNESAERIGVPVITCQNATRDRTVLVVKKSNSSSIEAGEKQNCYVLNVANCEYLKTAERFVVGSMAQINGVKI